MRISKFLLEHFTSDYIVHSFRPGHLSYPTQLAEALQATGYAYNSTTPGSDSSTNLPHLLTHGQKNKAKLPIVEFPITWEDETVWKGGQLQRRQDSYDGPVSPLDSPENLGRALEVAERIAQYGGVFNLLIHPNVTDDKLRFQEAFIEAFDSGGSLEHLYPYFTTIEKLGAWWLARDQVQVDVDVLDKAIDLVIPEPIAGLTLKLPADWIYTGNSLSGLNVLTDSQLNSLVIENEVSGSLRLFFNNETPGLGIMEHDGVPPPEHFDLSGVVWERFDGKLGSRDFDSRIPTASGIANNFTTGLPGGPNGDFTYRFTGYIDVQQAGTYTFFISTLNNGGNLYIGDSGMAKNENITGLSINGNEKWVQISLNVGKHPITVTATFSKGIKDLNLSWQGPGISKQMIPDSALYQNP